MHSQTNSSKDEILGFPVVATNVPQNNQILTFNNSRWVPSTIASSGGITAIGEVGTGASIIFGEFGGTAEFKTISGTSDIVITALSDQVQIGLNGSVVPSGGTEGDILFINNLGQHIFGKTINVNNNPMRFDNTNFQIGNTLGTNPTILSVMTKSTHAQPAVLGLGEEDTSNSWFFYYDSISKNFVLSQNGAATDKDFTINAGAGKLVLSCGLNLPNLPINSFVKTDNDRNLVSTTIGLNDITGVSVSGPQLWNTLAYNGTNWVNRRFYSYPTVNVEPGSVTAVLDNIYSAGTGGTVITLPTCTLGDTGRRIMVSSTQLGNISISVPMGIFVVVDGTGYQNITMTSNNLNACIEFMVSADSQYIISACSGKWFSAALSGKSFNATMSGLGDLKDTNISGPTNGQVLSYNGSQWINSTAAASVTSFNSRTGAVVPASGDYSLTQLSGVAISGPISGQVLSYDGTNWINSTSGVGTNIYDSDGTLTGNRTVIGAGNTLTFNDAPLFLQSAVYSIPDNNTDATDAFVSYSTATGRTKTMYAMQTSRSFKTFIPTLVNQADWCQFYSRTYTANIAVNLHVTFHILGTNDSSTAVWNVVGSISGTSGVWLRVPPLSSSFDQGNIYDLEARRTSNTLDLRIIKTWSASNPAALPYLIIHDTSQENGTNSTVQTTGSSGTLATAYYTAPRRNIQTNSGTGQPPSILFNWIPGYQVSIELCYAGTLGGSSLLSSNILINGFIVAIARGQTSGGGSIHLTPTMINTLNGGIITPGSNTLTFASTPFTNNQSYSVSITQTQ